MRRVVHVNPADPPPDRLGLALQALLDGALVALPTETFYGLAVDAFNSEALARLSQVKGTGEGSPILLLLADASQVALVSDAPPALFGPLAARFWPGPLTLVIPASARLPQLVSAGQGTVGVRVPGLALPRRLAAALGRPITGTSANVHGRLPCRTAVEVAENFPDGVAMILDGGPTPGGAPSTLLDLSVQRPRILREGQIPRHALRPFLPDLESADS